MCVTVCCANKHRRMLEESKREFKDDEIEALADLVENVTLEDLGSMQLPQGMTMESPGNMDVMADDR